MANVEPGDAVLDVACGTGDLTQAFAATSASRVVGGDFTPRMLDFAREKQQRLPRAEQGKIEYVEADAMNLQFGDATFDVVSIAFGIRNVSEPSRAIEEFHRVLKPGGRLIVLEFDRPRFAPMRWFNDFYCGTIMPRTATWISGDKSGAYRYLPKSVETFMSRESMIETMQKTGLRDVISKSLTFGICACYRALKP
jgi:demethylmenaquinone methyltransferase/2-methoxy-6-polyprenyl-1,4-benzoquinol methylase